MDYKWIIRTVISRNLLNSIEEYAFFSFSFVLVPHSFETSATIMLPLRINNKYKHANEGKNKMFRNIKTLAKLKRNMHFDKCIWNIMDFALLYVLSACILSWWIRSYYYYMHYAMFYSFSLTARIRRAQLKIEHESSCSFWWNDDLDVCIVMIFL